LKDGPLAAAGEPVAAVPPEVAAPVVPPPEDAAPVPPLALPDGAAPPQEAASAIDIASAARSPLFTTRRRYAISRGRPWQRSIHSQ
jgi:hypothetical protein